MLAARRKKGEASGESGAKLSAPQAFDVLAVFVRRLSSHAGKARAKNNKIFKIEEIYMNKMPNQNSADGNNLDSALKEEAEGYGDLVAISLVHKVSMKALRSRLKELQIERA